MWPETRGVEEVEMRTPNYLHARSRQGGKVPMHVSALSGLKTFNIRKQPFRVTIGDDIRVACFPLSKT